MYAASEKFHTAVYANNPSERVLIRMRDLCFHAEDIINSNLIFTEAVNNSEELTIGECIASTLEFKVLNDHGLLSGYSFSGECEAWIGVRTEKIETPDAPGMPYAILRYGLDQPVVLEGHLTEPYLTANGYVPTLQPPFPVHAILIEQNRVYCVSEDGDVWGAVWADGQTWDYMTQFLWDDLDEEVWDSIQGRLEAMDTLNIIPFMRAKFRKWAAKKRGLWHNGDIAYEFSDKVERYEYVPLGIFLPDQPKRRRVARIDFTAADRMTLFDADATAFLDSLVYPTTIGDILAKLCAYVGVTLASPSFINSTRVLEEALFDGEEVTCREILGWIAEAACAYARMTRDGEMEIVWFGTEAINIPMTQYFNIDVAEYEVQPIDKLQIMGSETDIGVIIGDGVNGYQIVDNPYLYGKNDAEVRPLGVPIYNRLAAFQAFSPINARAVCDWSIQAGDIISITLNGTTYALPIYRQTITWNGGGCRVTYESTGAASRPVMTAVNRRVFNQKRAMHEIVVNIDGISSRILDAEGNIANLELTARELDVKITDTAGALSSEIEQTVNGITLSVNNGDESSTFTLKAGEATLSTGTIKFDGMVTFAGLANGTTTINGGCIKTGEVDADRIDVDNLYVKHLDAADGTFKGNLTANSTQFNELNAVGNRVHIGPDYIDINGVEIGYVPYYSEICVIPSRAWTGNVGTSGNPWDQVVADKLYGSTQGEVSDRKLKDNIRPYSEDVIDRLKPSRFVLKRKPDIERIGFIAQDVQECVPEVVSELIDERNGTSILGLDYGALTCVLVDEAQRTRREIEALKARLDALEGTA